jgi:cell wall-associated NlpC family hydrolase
MDEKEKAERQAVVAEARTWMGTPYHDMARVKGAGVDCGMLLLEVFERCGLIDHVDVGYYSPDFYLHSSEPQYMNWVKKYAKEVQRQPLPGDFVLYNFGRCAAHGVIVVEWPTIIHAYKRYGIVSLDDATKGELPKRQAGIYSFWG